MIKTYGKIPLFLLLLIVGGLVLYSPTIRTFFTAFTTTIQDLYLDTKQSIQDGIERHVKQAETIETLRKREKSLEKRLIRYQSDVQNYYAMKSSLGLKPDGNITIVPVRAKGYALLGNFQQIWLEDFPDYNPLKNYGVIRAGYAVGIVVEQRRRPLMILAGDKECNFAVYIGKKRAPGIAMGKDVRHMVVKYIPEWMKLHIGDEVFTSGLDHIFPLGIPVGRVQSIEKMQGFKNAEITLYGDTLHPNFVWVVGY
ncbi:rod shape-determining protein MreC [Hydrogenimonas sp.]|uniref:rod shape-determining protein MreC n=1 Tax=Hydrogenimonas sp. TaxID=2231112 RepID=UPI002628EF99|nr:rod shape-determining protein MreC [Hydrogenimonas sp.]